MMHLTYNRRNVIGDGCAEKANGGLSDFGQAVVKEMNRVGVIVDIANSGWQTSLEAGVFWEPQDMGGIQRGKLVLQPNCLAPGDYLVAFGANSDDLSVCYALSDLGTPFSVRWDFPTWGKFIHPCQWIPLIQEQVAP